MFSGHRIQEGLKHLRVAVRHDQTDEASGSGADGPDDISAHMTSVIALRWSGTSLDPALSGSRIAFKSSFIAKEDLDLRVLQQPQELGDKLFALLLPPLFVWSFGNGTGYSPGVVVFMEVAQECSIADVQIALLLEPATKAHSGPVVSTGTAWVIHRRQDHLGDFRGRKNPGSACSGGISDAVDSGVIEAFDPELKAPLRAPRMLPGQFESPAAQKEGDGVESLLRLPVRAAIAGLPQLIERAVFWIGKLT